MTGDFASSEVRANLTRVAETLRSADIARLDADFIVGFLLGGYWRRAAGIPLNVVGNPPPAVVALIGEATAAIVGTVYDA